MGQVHLTRVQEMRLSDFMRANVEKLNGMSVKQALREAIAATGTESMTEGNIKGMVATLREMGVAIDFVRRERGPYKKTRARVAQLENEVARHEIYKASCLDIDNLQIKLQFLYDRCGVKLPNEDEWEKVRQQLFPHQRLFPPNPPAADAA
jgi:hypothetical protein